MNKTEKELMKEFDDIETKIEVLKKNQKECKIQAGSNVYYDTAYYTIGEKIERLESKLDKLDNEIYSIWKERGKV